MILGAARAALAQACCAGGAAVSPGRLQLFEDAAVAVGFRLVNQYGSFDTTGRYSGQPSGATELDLEQDFVGTLRVWRRGQVGLLVPIVETHRALPGMSDTGGGLGDVVLHGRWDFTRVGDDRIVPGVGALLGVTFPSGTPVEDSGSALGAGTTGFGAWQLSGGVSVEQVFGPAYVGVTTLLSQPFTREVGHVDEQLGLRFSVIGAGGYVFDRGQAIIGTLTFLTSGDATINGQAQSGTGERRLTAGLATGIPINLTWRLQATLFSDLPFGGQNHSAGFGGSVLLLHSWL